MYVCESVRQRWKRSERSSWNDCAVWRMCCVWKYKKQKTKQFKIGFSSIYLLYFILLCVYVAFFSDMYRIYWKWYPFILISYSNWLDGWLCVDCCCRLHDGAELLVYNFNFKLLHVNIVICRFSLSIIFILYFHFIFLLILKFLSDEIQFFLSRVNDFR